MQIGEFFKRSRQRLISCLPEETLEGVAKLMYAHGVGALPVCEVVGTRMVGIISERDLVRIFATVDWQDLRHLRVRDVMTKHVISCAPEETMQHAQDLMREHHFRHLPVMDGGRLIGMLSIRDTLALRLRESEEEIHVLRDAVVAARHR
jgi:CBS domain-containing protein